LNYRIPVAIVGVVLVACPFDSTLREYLNRRFWLPFSKHGASFLKKGVRRTQVPYAGIVPDNSGNESIAEVQRRYYAMSQPQKRSVPDSGIAAAIATARADKSLTARQREEVELVDAKVAMREAHFDAKKLASNRARIEAFLRVARGAAYRSEARGWLARVHYLLGDQTAAGKIYLDEMNRRGSNLSAETLLTSLHIVYGYDGGPKLRQHLAEYFDTPEHAAFAIQLLTNPRWRGRERQWMQLNPRSPGLSDETPQRTYVKIRELLDKHADLLQRNPEQNGLPMSAIRTALRMGDLPGALRIADAVPTESPLRLQPDFLWPVGAARFLSGGYAEAEAPLLALFNSKTAEEGKRAAAAYGLCGVYRKLGRPVDQLRYAVWLHEPGQQKSLGLGVEDLSIYYAPSGWDLNLLIEFEAPVGALQEFVAKYPGMKGVESVRYALAVRLARENRYEESAALYSQLGAPARTARMRRMAELSRAVEAKADDYEARFRLAQLIASNSEGIYFNDRLWGGLQRYAFESTTDGRLNL